MSMSIARLLSLLRSVARRSAARSDASPGAYGLLAGTPPHDRY